MTQTITVGKAARRNQIEVRPATNSKMDLTLARAAARLLPAVLNNQAKREALAKDLDKQAEAWQTRADAQNVAVSDYKRYLVEKAADARKLAKDIREGRA